MAGIGFELRRLKRHDTFLGTLQAYTASGIITSGPWIISIISIAILSVLLQNLTETAHRLLILSSDGRRLLTQPRFGDEGMSLSRQMDGVERDSDHGS